VLHGPLQFTPEGLTYRFEGRARVDRVLAEVVDPLLAVLQRRERARQDSNLRPPA